MGSKALSEISTNYMSWAHVEVWIKEATWYRPENRWPQKESKKKDFERMREEWEGGREERDIERENGHIFFLQKWLQRARFKSSWRTRSQNRPKRCYCSTSKNKINDKRGFRYQRKLIAKKRFHTNARTHAIAAMICKYLFWKGIFMYAVPAMRNLKAKSLN